jgi:O-acetyl-ADP-ribose deacetylase (regulator of RNase III)
VEDYRRVGKSSTLLLLPMVYRETRKDLFTVNRNKYSFAHCISKDCKMGAGIAVKMKGVFNLFTLKANIFPSVIFYNNVYNLVTKDKFYDKPTYESLEATLILMKDLAVKNRTKKIAMPKIGCGLDRLDWKIVKELIQRTFKDTNIEILICIV